MEFRLNTTFNCYYLLNLYYMSDKAKGFTSRGPCKGGTVAT